MLDFVIVGAGLYGSVAARVLSDRGYKCVVLDKRPHIGGNCYTEKKNGIQVHMYGPHFFHTNSRRVWDFLSEYTVFNSVKNQTDVIYKGSAYSFPINMFTLQKLWGVCSPEEAKRKLEEVKIDIPNPSNIEDFCLANIGEELYEIFVYGFTKKQWGKEPKDLPVSIIKRIPIRLEYNNNYFDDIYQGIPIGGYTRLFENLLDGIDVHLGVDYLTQRDKWKARKIIYTGPIDEFFDYHLGELEWRSLKFEHLFMKDTAYQGKAVFHYSDIDVPYKRIIEHKYFDFTEQKDTVITKEYPQHWDRTKEKFYPINDKKNNSLYEKYKKLIPDNFTFGGRLARYKYYDMDQVVASALKLLEI
jgi:UDP-galactopyranose mutase